MNRPAPGLLARRLAVLLVVVAGLAVVYRSPLHGLLVPGGTDGLGDWLARFGPWASVAFVGLCATGVGLGAPRLVFAAAAGLLFDAWIGVLLAQAGTLLGCLLAFTWARRLGGSAPRATSGRSQRFLGPLQQHPVTTQVALRLFPIGNGLALNVLLGLSSIGARDFAVGACLGTLPGTLVCVLFGSSANSASVGLLVAAGGAFAAMAVISTALLRRTAAAPEIHAGAQRESARVISGSETSYR